MRLREMAEQAQQCGCKDCLFWEAVDDMVKGSSGLCRALPPRPALDKLAPHLANDHLAIWPTTAPDDWCGGWMERRE